MPKKKLKKIAEALILGGCSISEASAQNRIPRRTIGDIIVKENLQSKQLEYLKSFRDEYRYYSNLVLIL